MVPVITLFLLCTLHLSSQMSLRDQIEDVRGDVEELLDHVVEPGLVIKRLELELMRPAAPENRTTCGKWDLAVNLNPSDGHIMDFNTGWTDGVDIGSHEEALVKDYVNVGAMELPADYIAIARHQDGVLEAVKVFKFRQWGRSLQSRFEDEFPGRMVVTEGGPIQVSIALEAQNLEADSIFGVGGDLIFNLMNQGDNAHRIVLSEGYLPGRDLDRSLPIWGNLARGVGNHFCLMSDRTSSCYIPRKHEISNYQSCRETCTTITVQGSDHGDSSDYVKTPTFGNYAIFVSATTDVFPLPGSRLQTVVEQC